MGNFRTKRSRSRSHSHYYPSKPPTSAWVFLWRLHIALDLLFGRPVSSRREFMAKNPLNLIKT